MKGYRWFVCLCFWVLSVTVSAQSSGSRALGIKAGMNFSHVTNLRSVSVVRPANRTGLMAGVYWAPPSGRMTGYRSELIYSRQGYDFQSGTASGSLMMDCLLLPQLMTINITRFLQLQAGAQLSLMLGAKADSVSSSSRPFSAAKALDYFNRLNYGAAGGVEIKPFAGLLIGARYNVFFGNMHEQLAEGGVYPSFIPANGEKLKNGLLQLYVGYEF